MSSPNSCDHKLECKTLQELCITMKTPEQSHYPAANTTMFAPFSSNLKPLNLLLMIFLLVSPNYIKYCNVNDNNNSCHMIAAALDMHTSTTTTTQQDENKHIHARDKQHLFNWYQDDQKQLMKLGEDNVQEKEYNDKNGNKSLDVDFLKKNDTLKKQDSNSVKNDKHHAVAVVTREVGNSMQVLRKLQNGLKIYDNKNTAFLNDPGLCGHVSHEYTNDPYYQSGQHTTGEDLTKESKVEGLSITFLTASYSTQTSGEGIICGHDSGGCFGVIPTDLSGATFSGGNGVYGVGFNYRSNVAQPQVTVTFGDGGTTSFYLPNTNLAYQDYGFTSYRLIKKVDFDSDDGISSIFALSSLTLGGVCSQQPSQVPSNSPSTLPSISPSTLPSISPSRIPTTTPSFVPSTVPSKSASPSVIPTEQPSTIPSKMPTISTSNSKKSKSARSKSKNGSNKSGSMKLRGSKSSTSKKSMSTRRV